MVEEMYKEEFSEMEMMNNSKEGGIDSSSEDRREELNNPVQTQNRRLREESFVTDSETTKSPVDNHGIYLDDDAVVRTNQASYDDISELSSIVVRNNNNNNNRHVSLALELRHCESEGFSTLGGSHIRGDDESAAASLDYHCTETEQQERRRFSNPHLLHDFVV